MYNIKLKKFEGPLDLLLQLIEREEMNISEISLANIADEFIEYIRGGGKEGIGGEGGIGQIGQVGQIGKEEIEKLRNPGNEKEIVESGREGISGVDANELSDFLVIAAKLLYIKSRYLMPFLECDDEEEDAGDLENRLKIYKEFLDASKVVEEYYGSWKRAFAREAGIGQIGGIGQIVKAGGGWFFPPEKLEKKNLKSIFEEFVNGLRSPFVLDQEQMERTITVQERIEQIRLLILKKADISFAKIINMADKKDVIVSFLSILELVKEQFIVVEQDGYFSEIRIRKYEI